MKKLLTYTMTLIIVILVTQTAHAGIVPQAASAMGREMDRQVTARFGYDTASTNRPSIFITTPVDVNNLKQAVPLARQMQEELMRWFVQAGYTVHEIRKSADILVDDRTGEVALTRKTNLLSKRNVSSGAFLTGTYTITPRSIRFNMRLVRTDSQSIIAMSTITVPIHNELAPLLSLSSSNQASGVPITPSVLTSLP